MEQQTAVAETSPAPVMEVSRGPVVDMTPDQRTEWRKTGEVPKPKVEEPATSTEEPQETATEVETEVTPEPKKPQEKQKSKPTAEDRIAQLEATIEKIRKGSGAERKTETQAVTPVKADPQATRQKPTVDAKDDKGNPKYETYEDFVEDLGDWKAEQRIAADRRDQAQQQQQREMNSKIAEAKQRYGAKFDEVLEPTVTAILGDKDVSGTVKAMLNDSDILPDLMFTIGSDEAEMSSFMKMAKENTGKAIRYIALTESLIREELEGKTPKTEAPVKPQTQAPRPPAEVGGRAASPGDPLKAAAEAGDFRSFKAEATRRQLAKMKG